MKTAAFKYGSLLIGLIAAVIIIVSQSVSLDASTVVPAKEHSVTGKAETKSDSKGDYSFYTISATSFPAAAQINFFQEASCLFEVIFSNDIPSTESEQVEIPINKFYSTILRVFISPNAP